MKRYCRYMILVTLAVALLVLAGEMLVRAFPVLLPVERQIRTQAVLMKDRVQPDKDTGFVRLPNLRQEVRTLDFSFVREADDKGFPNRGSWPKHADFVFLGDSFITGEGVGLDNSFVRKFAREVQELSVRNLGVTGAGPDRQYRIYQKYGAALRPKVVLAVFYAAADLVNVTHFQTWLKEASHRDYNRFRLDLGRAYGRLSLLDPLSILERSRLMEAVGGQLAEWSGEDNSVVYTRDGSTIYITPATLEFLSTEMQPDDSRLEAALAPYIELNRQLRSIGAEFFVVLAPSKEEVYGDAEAVISVFKKRLTSSSVPYLDLYPLLRDEAQGRPLYYLRDPHLNERGNSVIAKYLVDWWRGRSTNSMHTRVEESQIDVSFSSAKQESHP